jgi:nephrocystin-4
VKAYPNAHDEMVVAPKEHFKLAADAVQELNIGLRLLKSGTKFYYLNVVDIESFQLVYSWFVYVHSKPPVISKAFELTLPAYTGGNASNYTLKRVQYTNPYASEKIFMISTSHEHLLSFKETRMRFMPNEVKTLGLKFLPNLKPGFVEILVFINNENDTNEETFAIRGTFVNSME